jgi:hypothetical protein
VRRGLPADEGLNDVDVDLAKVIAAQRRRILAERPKPCVGRVVRLVRASLGATASMKLLAKRHLRNRVSTQCLPTVEKSLHDPTTVTTSLLSSRSPQFSYATLLASNRTAGILGFGLAGILKVCVPPISRRGEYRLFID